MKSEMTSDGWFREALRRVLMDLVEPPSPDLRHRVLTWVRTAGTPALSGLLLGAGPSLRVRLSGLLSFIQTRWWRPR